MRAGLRSALFLVFLLGSLGVVAAEAEIITYRHFLYLAAENLLAVGVVIAVILALTLNGSPENAPLPRWIQAHPDVFSVIAGAVSATASVAILIVYGGEFIVYEAIIGVSMGAAVGVLTYAALHDIADIPALGQDRPLFLYAVLAALLVVAGLLRLFAPNSPALTFVFAPILYFLLPGLALTFALLPRNASLLEHAVYAAPISIGAQFIGIAWFVQLGIALTPLLFYASASAIILIGFGIALVRTRSQAA